MHISNFHIRNFLAAILALKIEGSPTRNLPQAHDLNSQTANQQPLSLSLPLDPSPPPPLFTKLSTYTRNYIDIDIDFNPKTQQPLDFPLPPQKGPILDLSPLQKFATHRSTAIQQRPQDTIKGRITMHSTLSHTIPLSFALTPHSYPPLTPRFALLTPKLSYQLQARYVDGLSFPSTPFSSSMQLETGLEHTIDQRKFDMGFSMSLAPSNAAGVMGIGGEELGALIRLFERSVLELDRGVRERGGDGVGSVVLETVIEGVGVVGELQVRDVVDGGVEYAGRD